MGNLRGDSGETNDPEKSLEGVDVAVGFQDAGGAEAEFFPINSDAGGAAIVTESFPVDADSAECYSRGTGGAAGEFFPVMQEQVMQVLWPGQLLLALIVQL